MIIVNGQPADVDAGETVMMVLVRLGVESQARGVAVAVDGEVIPRSQWSEFALDRDARVEVVTAMQGG